MTIEDREEEADVASSPKASPRATSPSRTPDDHIIRPAAAPPKTATAAATTAETSGRHTVVVGSGVAGLSAAYTLCKYGGARDRVTLLESDDRPGGHACTVPTPAGEDVDIGFMVMNPSTYPNLLRIFAETGSEVEPSDMSLSVFGPGHAWSFQKSRLLEILTSPRHWRFIFALRAFGKEALAYLGAHHAADTPTKATTPAPTLRDLFGDRLDRDFEEHWLVPMIAAVWSCPESAAMDSPALATLEFLRNHQLLGVDQAEWMTPKGRSHTYVRNLLGECRAAFGSRFELKLSTAAARVDAERRVLVLDGGAEIAYDSIILAGSAPAQAALSPPAERWLRRFETSRNEVAVHSEPSGVPPRLADRCSWNVETGAKGGVRVTYWLSRLQNLRNDSLFVSINPKVEPPGTFHRRILEHPVMNAAAYTAQREEAQHQGEHGVYHAGAWLRHGFHEDGAFTGVLAARRALGSAGTTVPLEFPTSPVTGISAACAVTGTTTHERFRPVSRKFRYPLYQYRFDLRSPPAGFVRKDHFGDVTVPLDTCVRRELADRVGLWPTGRIEAVCNLRCVGLAFNPITAYFAHEGSDLVALLLEVHNTPWEEKCLYAMRCGARSEGGAVTLEPSVMPKVMHVSPFNRPPGQGKESDDIAGKVPAPLYHFSLVRLPQHDTLVITVRDPLAADGNDADDSAPLLVRATWTVGHVAAPDTLPQHEVSTGSWRALAQVYWQALQMVAVHRIPLYKYEDAPPTPVYFGIVSAACLALLWLASTLVQNLSFGVLLVFVLIGAVWAAATYGWQGSLADSASTAAINTIFARYAPHTKLLPIADGGGGDTPAADVESSDSGSDSDSSEPLPEPESPAADAELAIRLRVPSAAFLKGLASIGELHLGESYMRGEWSVLPPGASAASEGEALYALLSRLAGVSEAAERAQIARVLFPSFWLRYVPFVARFGTLDRVQSADVIHEHYDERVELYRAFLGRSMVYTCAMFEAGETWRDLQAAQQRKVDRILDLARVGSGTRLLDIGCGFGTLCGSAAARGADALGVCNSHSMIETAKRRHGTSGGTNGDGGSSSFEFHDYRDLPRTEDRDVITCVEMIEAVPCRHYRHFVAACDRQLRPGGRVVMQVIHAFGYNNPVARKADPQPLGTFVTTHIFPGCQIPVLERLQAAFHDSGRFELERTETCGIDYATTLKAWRLRLDAAAPRFKPSLVRKYRYYLAFCEAGFRSEMLHLSRIVFVKKES